MCIESLNKINSRIYIFHQYVLKNKDVRKCAKKI